SCLVPTSRVETLLGIQFGRRYESEDMTGWETQPGMVQKLVETRVRCQAILGVETKALFGNLFDPIHGWVANRMRSGMWKAPVRRRILVERQAGQSEALEDPVGFRTGLIVAFIAILLDGLYGVVAAHLRKLLAREV